MSEAARESAPSSTEELNSLISPFDTLTSRQGSFIFENFDAVANLILGSDERLGGPASSKSARGAQTTDDDSPSKASKGSSSFTPCFMKNSTSMSSLFSIGKKDKHKELKKGKEDLISTKEDAQKSIVPKMQLPEHSKTTDSSLLHELELQGLTRPKHSTTADSPLLNELELQGLTRQNSTLRISSSMVGLREKSCQPSHPCEGLVKSGSQGSIPSFSAKSETRLASKKPRDGSGEVKSSPLMSLLRKTKKVKSKVSLDELQKNLDIKSSDGSMTSKCSAASSETFSIQTEEPSEIERQSLKTPFTNKSSESLESQKAASQKSKESAPPRSPWLHRVFKNQKKRQESEPESMTGPSLTPVANISRPCSPISSSPKSKARYSHITVDARPNMDEIISDISKFFPGIQELDIIEDSSSPLKPKMSYRQSALFVQPSSNLADTADAYVMLQSSSMHIDF
jgi:hypothetical protein